MHYDLLIVGNGFDLACNYKTSYSDFLEYEGGKGYTNPLISFFSSAYHYHIVINDEWNGFENLLCQYLQFLDYLFNNTDNVERHFTEQYYDAWGNPVSRYYELKIRDVSKLPQNVYLILMLSNPLDKELIISPDKTFRYVFSRIDDYENIKEVYFKVFINSPITNSSNEYVLKLLLKELHSRLLKLEKELKDYIALSTNGDLSVPATIFDFEVDRVISFNYSKTAQRMFELDDGNVAYVHGDINSNIVVGVEQSMINKQSFKEESDYILFFKRFRRIFKDCNKNYNDKIIRKLNRDSVIGIYGHSLDLSDVSLLKPLFDNKYKRYDIYCYKDVNIYKIKLVNLLGLDLFDDLEKDGKINLIKI